MTEHTLQWLAILALVLAGIEAGQLTPAKIAAGGRKVLGKLYTLLWGPSQ